MSDFVKELNFDGDTFNDMKRDMNFVLQRLLGNMQEKECQEGPLDGVYAETKGTYTKFKGTGAFQKEKRILHQKVADVGIKASLQTGMVSINDRNRNQAIAVSITEMVAVLNEALRYGTAGMGKKVRL